MTFSIGTAFVAGLGVAAGVHAVLRARDWPFGPRLGAWVIACQLWVLAAILIALAFFLGR